MNRNAHAETGYQECPSRAAHEIEHGKKLALGDPETIWGWGSPAGRVRAQRRAQLIAGGAQLRPGVRVLEIGCGTGLFTEIFAATGANLVAVDISAELLAKARSRNLPPNQVIFLEKRFEDCGVDGPFHAVIGSSVLHHLQIESALDRIYDLLKPGGQISFAEPNMLNPQVFLERKLPFLRSRFWYISPDETAFVRWSLAALLKKHGFQDVRIVPFDWVHPATPAHLIQVMSVLGRCLECIPILREFSGSLYIHASRL